MISIRSSPFLKNTACFLDCLSGLKESQLSLILLIEHSSKDLTRRISTAVAILHENGKQFLPFAKNKILQCKFKKNFPFQLSTAQNKTIFVALCDKIYF